MPLLSGVIDEAARLDVAIVRLFPQLTRSRAGSLVKSGATTVDGRVVRKPAMAVGAGDVVQIQIPDLVAAEAAAEDLPIRIVYEDAHVVVIDKAPGMVVHPSPGHATGTLVNALLHHIDDLSGVNGVERPGIVHRLDRGTSGLLVVAKSDEAHRHLAAQFADHSAGRTYLAVTLGAPKDASGTIRSTLGRHPTDRVRFASVERGRPAVTHWRRVGHHAGVALVECTLETGRTHQVRVHLSEQGWPIIGDPLYGPASSRLSAALRAVVADERPLLHAWKLRFQHPDGRALELEAPIPADFQAALEAAGLRNSK